MFRFNSIAIYVLLTWAISSCTKQGPEGPAGPDGPPGNPGANGGTSSSSILAFSLIDNSQAQTVFKFEQMEFYPGWYNLITRLTPGSEPQTTLKLTDSTDVVEQGLFLAYMRIMGPDNNLLWVILPSLYYGDSGFRENYDLEQWHDGYRSLNFRVYAHIEQPPTAVVLPSYKISGIRAFLIGAGVNGHAGKGARLNPAEPPTMEELMSLYNLSDKDFRELQ